MSQMKAKTYVMLNSSIIILSLCFFAMIDQSARLARRIPEKPSANAMAPVHIVETQRDVFAVYKNMGLSGARIIHFNRHFNLVPYEPWETKQSEPFPIAVDDVGLLYESGITSHNWLYVATRLGMVRNIISVVPDSVFKERFKDMMEHPDYSYEPPIFRGHSFDTPRSIVTLDALYVIDDPVLINIDAGYFIDGMDPEKIQNALRTCCPDVRGIILIRSSDEPDLDRSMQGKLRLFMKVWQRTS